MKTTKSIIALLFMLLTAQAALAWYDPSTQRWLSRDPIGELGFQTLQSATAMPRIGTSVPRPSAHWIIRDSLINREQINLYEFVRNRPTDLYDRYGLLATPCQVAEANLAWANIVYNNNLNSAAAFENLQQAWENWRNNCPDPPTPPSPPPSMVCPAPVPPGLPAKNPNPYQNNQNTTPPPLIPVWFWEGLEATGEEILVGAGAAAL
jgi:hypothetical protein